MLAMKCYIHAWGGNILATASMHDLNWIFLCQVNSIRIVAGDPIQESSVKSKGL